MNPTHPTPNTPTTPLPVCGADHLGPGSTGFTCTRHVGHGGDHEARDGTIVYRRWPIDPPVPPNPCPLEAVPDGAEVAYRRDAVGWTPVDERRHYAAADTAVWWRWPRRHDAEQR